MLKFVYDIESGFHFDAITFANRKMRAKIALTFPVIDTFVNRKMRAKCEFQKTGFPKEK